ncbi:MAG: hypothetical protein EXR99_08660 [Gemmataceae bacterium]|nr:hypothetical protein [Gemmataceae bacterium]
MNPQETPWLDEEQFDPFWNTLPLREALEQRVEVDFLTTVRCPVCHHPLVARQGKKGPGFFCACHPFA